LRVTIVSPFDPMPPHAPERGSGDGPARPGSASPRDARRAHVGGVERVLHRMALEVARRGHEVTLLCSTAGPGSEDQDGPLRVVRVRRAATLMRAPLAPLAQHIAPGEDVVHVPATYPLTTEAVLRSAASRRVPAVLDFHFEPVPASLAGRAAGQAWSAWGPRSYPLAGLVVVRSLAYARAAPSLRGVHPGLLRVVPNGVDPEVFRPGAAPGTQDTLLVVGRLVPYKGVDVLLRALASMTGAPPLLVAGDGPERPRLVALARRLGVDARFLGRVPDEELPALYRAARLTVLPSINRQEAFGITLIESMACGTPVVASRLPGVAEVASLAGVLAEPGDPASLAAALEQALRNDELPRGPALARAVAARYAWPVVAGELVKVYEEVAGSRPAKVEKVMPHALAGGLSLLRA